MKRRRVIGRTGIVRWVPDPVAEAIASRRRAVDELICHPDVWARIAEHAETAARARPDEWGRDVLVALSGCARILAAGPESVDGVTS